MPTFMTALETPDQILTVILLLRFNLSPQLTFRMQEC